MKAFTNSENHSNKNQKQTLKINYTLTTILDRLRDVQKHYLK